MTYHRGLSRGYQIVSFTVLLRVGSREICSSAIMADEKNHRTESSNSKPGVEHKDRTGSPTTSSPTTAEDVALQASAKAENPLAGLGKEELSRMADEYCARYGFDNEEDLRIFRLGALIAGNDFQWDTTPGLTDEEIKGLEFERDHKYTSLPKTLVGVVVVCVSHHLFRVIKINCALTFSIVLGNVCRRPGDGRDCSERCSNFLRTGLQHRRQELPT